MPPSRRPSSTARIASGSKPEHDQEELQHLVVDRAGQPAEKRVDQHDGRRQQHGRVKAPSQHQLEQQPERVHRDAGREHRHHRRT